MFFSLPKLCRAGQRALNQKVMRPMDKDSGKITSLSWANPKDGDH